MPAIEAESEMLTSPAIALKWGCSHSKVLTLIQTGQLRATNLSLVPNGVRAKWRVKKSDLAAFEEARSNYRLIKERATRVVQARRNA
jgi:hypothetical protein